MWVSLWTNTPVCGECKTTYPWKTQFVICTYKKTLAKVKKGTKHFLKKSSDFERNEKTHIVDAQC